MSFVETIARKRDGGGLDPTEIADFVHGASEGTLPPEQLAALLMAICCRGMDSDETRCLTEEMVRSGEVWRLADSCPDAVDKHSTGGVGDTVSLVVAPLLVAVGVPVAMMSGRGLGHSQGTLDKLAAIPGFQTRWDRRGMLRLIDRCGAALVAQSDEIAPADRTLYSLRDVTGTVPSLPLIVASIMSKKLALGAATLVLDVKWGTGAFRKTVAEASELAAALCSVARGAGIATEALVTDMNQPLGPALGTACEVRAAVDVLGGGGDPMLRTLSSRLCEEAMVMRGWKVDDARSALDRAVSDGSALAAWQSIVNAHGGDPQIELLPTDERRIHVLPRETGVVAEVDAEDLGWVAVAVGAGRRTRDEEVDHGAGLLVHARIGQRVDPREPLATVLLGRRPVDETDVCRRVQAAFRLSDEEVAPPDLVVGRVDEGFSLKVGG